MDIRLKARLEVVCDIEYHIQICKNMIEYLEKDCTDANGHVAMTRWEEATIKLYKSKIEIWENLLKQI